MQELKLHGWITPADACEMVRELLKYLYNNNRDDFEYFRKYIKYYEVVECPCTITNVPNVI